MEKIIISDNEDKLIPVLWTGDESVLAYDIVLAGVNARVKFLALLIGRGEDKVDMKVKVTHEGKDTKSEVIIKSVLYDKASISFDGLISIQPGAKGTQAWLAAHMLLLSPKARGTAIPNLEILENDIKAGHATTVGRVSNMELFYLMSRGLSEETAKGLIVEGFLQSIIEMFPESLAKRTKQQLA